MKVAELFALLDDFTIAFEVVEPRKLATDPQAPPLS